jgi:uncharacterized membrane protein YqjE
MAGKEDRTEGEHSPGFLHSLKVALALVTSALHTRLELFVTELEEERERLKQALLLTLLLFFCLSFAFILLNIFVVALFWEGVGFSPSEGSRCSTSLSEWAPL